MTSCAHGERPHPSTPLLTVSSASVACFRACGVESSVVCTCCKQFTTNSYSSSWSFWVPATCTATTRLLLLLLSVCPCSVLVCAIWLVNNMPQFEAISLAIPGDYRWERIGCTQPVAQDSTTTDSRTDNSTTWVQQCRRSYQPAPRSNKPFHLCLEAKEARRFGTEFKAFTAHHRCVLRAWAAVS